MNKMLFQEWNGGTVIAPCGADGDVFAAFCSRLRKNMIAEAAVSAKFCIFAAYSFNRIMERY